MALSLISSNRNRWEEGLSGLPASDPLQPTSVTPPTPNLMRQGLPSVHSAEQEMGHTERLRNLPEVTQLASRRASLNSAFWQSVKLKMKQLNNSLSDKGIF